MEYKTVYKSHRLLIKPSIDPLTKEESYTVWQCMYLRQGWRPVAGWGGYVNATQALADFKRKMSNR